ncbi:hypothetical protein D915_000654 [Fasciola hepatica]|uniref:CBM21 domain-containing protein n=1 Tax=Fasciola hepatica TaxID=6192 RepID=A0A4E0RZZ3_FASHE|nr:hypothetical protein D915_000654 [Fasciola hepatica]
MCGRHRLAVNSNNGYLLAQMNSESTLPNENACLHSADSSDVLNRNETPDRHQGWHTEFHESNQTKRRTRPATDYVVRTSFLRDASKTKSTDGNRVNLVLRFRSLLSRRAQQQKLHAVTLQNPNKLLVPSKRAHGHKTREERRQGSDSGCHSPTPLNPAFISVDSFEDYVKNSFRLKRSNSDTCLSRPHIHSHAIFVTIPNTGIQSSGSAASGASPVSDQPDASQGQHNSGGLPCVSEAAELTQSDTEESTSMVNSQNHRPSHVRRRSSLSTGNICCLYALRCLPSIEYLNNPSSPVLARRRSLPAPSLKPFPHYDGDRTNGILRQSHTPFALAAMRHHPCYQDMTCNLRNWIRETLDMEGSSESTLNEDADGTVSATANVHDSSEWNRRVRFADEATASSSATTLNSLSASSSARSLSSLILTPNMQSPVGSLSSLDRGNTCSNRRTSLSAKLASLHPLPRRLVKKFSQMSTSRSVATVGKNSAFAHSRQTDSPTKKLGKSENMEKNKFAVHGIWRRHNKRHRERKTTPLITVNLIKDYSEPPEVPEHVLKELEVDVEQFFWQPMFVNPEELPQFNQNLFKQRLHLGRLWSFSLSSVNVEACVVVSHTLEDDQSPQVRLRYTLNGWRNYSESCVLTKMHTVKRTLPHCDPFWVEIHSGRVQLQPDDVDSANWKPEKLEFAVVARRNGSEWWDNNNRENYICHQHQTGST